MSEEHTTRAYFDELAAHLRSNGAPEAKVTSVVAELRDYVGESDNAPQTEFGPAAELAAQLAGHRAPGAADAPAPEPGAQRWVWTADAYVDQEMMNRFGAQGWEIERVDRLGRFISHREPRSTLRWEYRRDVVDRKDRATLTARIAPDGWEPCGHWMYLAYHKRPLAASTGPAAALDKGELPKRPRRSVYFTRKLYAGLLTFVVAAAVSGTLTWYATSDHGSGQGLSDGTYAGFACGAALGLALATRNLHRMREKFRRASRYPDDA
ncbi:hypothetical protein [Streptomyces beihaiensis]|uniref:DUF2812 domain-containing protein n=1 Tax=Streptomyces beihaiensis TaxID=2984495 RepID=A0ABT3TVZ2_9ACTN|nr:hypothetical protein [Streptomyces beihaiensis]MCX3060552.1 hypothetical protein [Streptomyces beihaiensis]